MTDNIETGQPVVATQKAHTMTLEVLAEWGLEPRSTTLQQFTDAATEALCRAIEQQEDLRHDLERQMAIANEHVDEVDTLLREIETLRVEALAERVNGYYIGFAKADEQSDVLRDALADLLHAICGEKGFAEAVRRDSGRIYPWPALELAEAKARAILDQSK